MADGVTKWATGPATRDAQAAALTAAGERDLLVLGSNVVNQCLAAGLVDEILIHLVPELLGDGVRLFNAGQSRDSLETLEILRSGQVANLRYQVGVVRTHCS
ncbi:MAG: dihydrofolate reductase family protein, partial [Solirubrobacteraceae bacterium]